MMSRSAQSKSAKKFVQDPKKVGADRQIDRVNDVQELGPSIPMQNQHKNSSGIHWEKLLSPATKKN